MKNNRNVQVTLSDDNDNIENIFPTANEFFQNFFHIKHKVIRLIRDQTGNLKEKEVKSIKFVIF